MPQEPACGQDGPEAAASGPAFRPTCKNCFVSLEEVFESGSMRHVNAEYALVDDESSDLRWYCHLIDKGKWLDEWDLAHEPMDFFCELAYAEATVVAEETVVAKAAEASGRNRTDEELIGCWRRQPRNKKMVNILPGSSNYKYRKLNPRRPHRGGQTAPPYA